MFGIIDSPLDQFFSISTGHTHVCAITLSASLSCWGSNNLHQLQIPQLTSYTGFKTVTLGGHYTCVIIFNTNPEIQAHSWVNKCWGSINVYLDQAKLIKREEIMAVPGGYWGNAHVIAAGNSHACVILDSNKTNELKCFGANDHNQTDNA